MNFVHLLSKMFVLFAFIGVGLLCQKLGFLDDHTTGKLNKLVIFVCAPSLILNSVFGTEYTYAARDILLLIFYGTAYNTITFLLALLVTRIFRPDAKIKKTFTFLIAYSNCVFMGFPIIASVLGDTAVFLASVCVLPYNFFLYILGVIFLSGKSDTRQFITKTLLNPSSIATVLSLFIFFFQVKVPTPVEDIFSYLGNMVVPLAMMLIGVSLGKASLKEIFSDLRIYKIALCRLIILPLLVFCVMRLIIHNAFFLNLITVLSVMPSASVSPIFCTEYGGDALFASKGVFVTTLFALITVPVLLSFLLL